VVKRRNSLRDTVVKVDDFPFDLGASGAARPAAELKVA
jgi:acyl-CoA dehydrogenase